MPQSEKLFLTHPTGDPTTLPCTHLVQQHVGGDPITVPCIHGVRQQHPSGDVVFGVTVPCIHFVPVHPAGDPATVPCVHIVQQHPAGHPGPTFPCTHPLAPLSSAFNGAVQFYTNDPVIRQGVIDAVNRLSSLGVSLLSFRPLNVFHRTPLGDGGGDDPFWSHYNPLFHSIQVIDDGQSDTSKLETLRHEVGHALVGNQITNHYAGGSHTLTSPADSYALAMSEGWAHFVALVLTHGPAAGNDVTYKGRNWENLSIASNGKVEYCVGAALWDLFDTSRRVLVSSRFGTIGRLESDDPGSVAFSEIFRVYSPTLGTIFNGPWISSIWDFMDRIKKNNPGNTALHSLVDDATVRNVGARPSDAPQPPLTMAATLARGTIGAVVPPPLP